MVVKNGSKIRLFTCSSIPTPLSVTLSLTQGFRGWSLRSSSPPRKVPVEVLQIFKRVAETYDGEATATVEQTDENAAIYSCGGCFMGVPAEIINVLSNRDEIMRCSNCTRILVLEDSDE